MPNDSMKNTPESKPAGTIQDVSHLISMNLSSQNFVTKAEFKDLKDDVIKLQAVSESSTNEFKESLVGIKKDLNGLEKGLNDLEEDFRELREDVRELRKDVKGEFRELRRDVKEDLREFEGRITREAYTNRWMAGALVSVAVAIIKFS